MTVTRYGTSCAEHPEGCFVKFSEYEKVVAERDAYVSALADCREVASDDGVDNPYFVAAVGNPSDVAPYVAYAIEWLSGMVDHWQANHDNQVSRARFLIERGDIPLERVRAYNLFSALLGLEEAVRDQRAMFEDTSDEFNMSGTGITQALDLLDAERAKEQA